MNRKSSILRKWWVNKNLGLLVFFLAASLKWGGHIPRPVQLNYLPVQPVYMGKSLANLVSVETCADVLSRIKSSLLQSMETQVDANLQNDLLELASAQDDCTSLSHYGGFGCSASQTVETSAGDYEAVPEQPDMAETSEEEAASDYSTTNNQVAAVDEADFIKNDGSYIYILANNRFQILDAWPPGEAKQIASIPIEGTPKNLFVYDNRAVIYSTLPPNGMERDAYEDRYPSSYWNNSCTYAYDCQFAGDGQYLKVTVVDLLDKQFPQVIREMKINGSYLSARRIENQVYTIVIFPEVLTGLVYYYPAQYDFYKVYGCGERYTQEELVSMYEELKAQNREQIESADLARILPSIKDIQYKSQGSLEKKSERPLDCKDFFLTQEADGRNLLSILSFKMDRLDPLSATTIVGKPGVVYANEEALYIASRHYLAEMSSWYFEDTVNDTEATTLHKFRLSTEAPAAQYIGSGVVKGRILNQFAMDEQAGYLRIATTTGYAWGQGTHNTLSVVTERGGHLTTVGELNGIAPGEDIRSVRFDGDTGFIVTFKKTDPLFVIDLHDPAQPKIKGELKIPGFSTYLHRIDPDHLLTIGYDADDEGDFAWYKGIMLQIFEVTDPNHPKLIHKKYIGTRGSNSEAAINHLAFNYFAPRNLLALPMVVCTGGGNDGLYGSQMTFNGLMVYRVTLENGFEYLGGIPYRQAETQSTATSLCGGWWTQSNTTVKRSIFMEDYAYSIAFDKISIASLADLDTPITTINLLE